MVTDTVPVSKMPLLLWQQVQLSILTQQPGSQPRPGLPRQGHRVSQENLRAEPQGLNPGWSPSRLHCPALRSSGSELRCSAQMAEVLLRYIKIHHRWGACFSIPGGIIKALPWTLWLGSSRDGASRGALHGTLKCTHLCFYDVKSHLRKGGNGPGG